MKKNLYTKKVIDAWIEELLYNREFIEKVELVEVEGKSQYRFTLKKAGVRLVKETKEFTRKGHPVNHRCTVCGNTYRSTLDICPKCKSRLYDIIPWRS